MPPELENAAGIADGGTAQGTDDKAAPSTAPADAGEGQKPTAPAEQATQQPDAKNLYEHVKDVLAKKREPKAAAPAEDPAGGNKEGDDAPGEDGKTKAATGGEGEPSDEDKLEPIKNPRTASDHRWNRLLKERKSLEPDAQVTRQMRAFVQQNGMTQDHVTEALQFAKLLATDRKAAFKEVSRLHSELAAEFGEADLPADLQEAVESGRTTEELAREVARARANAKHAETTAEAVRAREAERQAEEDRATLVKTVTDATSAYVAKWKSSDPDFAKKEKLVTDKVRLWLAEGKIPKDASEAVQQVDAARKEVEEQLSSLLPRRPNTRDLNGGAPTNTSGAAPANIYEAARQGLVRTRAAS